VSLKHLRCLKNNLLKCNSVELTKEQFIALSEHEQENFFADGGKIIPSVPPTDTLKETEQAEIQSCSPPKVDEPPAQSTSQSPSFSELPANDKDGILIADPVELLFLVDEDIITGKVELYDWQVQFMEDFARGGPSADKPFQAAVRACNGSGKDKYVIAACAVWVCIRYRQTTCPVTSASGFQLDTQTCKHIRRLCESWNRKFGQEMWDCKYRHYTFRFDPNDNLNNSEIHCYATDEPGKAEGFHPTEAGARMAIFCSEDKSVPDTINNALNKCTGYTHRVHVSTPGSMRGHFYNYCNMAVKRDSIKDVLEVGSADWIEYHINSDKCPHLGKNYKAQAAKNIPGGMNSPAYQSQVEAEFGSDEGEMLVIPFTYIWQAIRKTQPQQWFPENFNTIGLDLSDGGAECAFTVRNGNKHLVTIGFKFHDTQDTIDYLDDKFREWNMNHPEARIYGDCIGIGKPILDSLKRKGWKNIVFFDSRAAAANSTVYKNRNAENWFHTRLLLEKNEVIFAENETTEGLLATQLSSRHYKLMEGKIHQMLTKMEEKAKGNPSPDRADSFTYCFWGYKSQVTIEHKNTDKPFELPAFEEKTKGDFTLKGWAGANDKRSKWDINGGVNKEDFVYLQDEIAELNRSRNLTVN
jgi:hypothetical protein